MPGSFHETFAVDLPSQTTVYTGARTCASPPAVRSGGGGGGREAGPVESKGRPPPAVHVVARLATEHHAVELVACQFPGGAVEFDALARRLPRASAAGGHRKSRGAGSAGDGDRTCVAHSALPARRNGPGGGGGSDGAGPSGAAAAAAALGEGSAVEAFALRRGPRADGGGSGEAAARQQRAPHGDGGADGGAAAAAAASGQEPDHPKQPHDGPKAGHRRQESASKQVAPSGLDASTHLPATEDVQLLDKNRPNRSGGSNSDAAEAFLVVRGQPSVLFSARDAEGPGPVAVEERKAGDEVRPERGDDHSDVAVCTVTLTYQPLVVRVAGIDLDDGTRVVGAFVGSADDARLRLYLPKPKGRRSSSLEDYGVSDQVEFMDIAASVTLNLDRGCSKDGGVGSGDELLNLLSLSSPVMAVDVLALRAEEKQGRNEKSVNYLAVGCQDGTIRVVSFTCRKVTGIGAAGIDGNQPSEYAFTVVGTTTAVIDGPIVTLQLSSRIGARSRPGMFLSTSFPTVNLVVGSLCGFACSFLQVDGPGGIFDGPDGIVTDLWSGKLDAEDSVLCVHAFSFGGTEAGSAVAIGTYSGRLIVFEPQVIFDELAANAAQIIGYQPFWSCQLPYPIHGVSSADLDGDGLPELLVTTRKSLHILRGNTDDIVKGTKKRILNFFRES